MLEYNMLKKLYERTIRELQTIDMFDDWSTEQSSDVKRSTDLLNVSNWDVTIVQK
jgi:hypothetical protein